MEMRAFVFLVLLLTLWSVNSTPITSADSTCVPNACHPLDPAKINVHLVAHSHDDVGWLQTYDEYYIGAGDFTSYKTAGVKYILDSTIPELLKNPDRRYIQVETAFFFKWWNEQSNETRDAVRDLVNSGRLEMINGGWSMNDEAAAHYQSIIDQFTWGFRILEDTVGECGRPKIGWQIDPFGHSREHASLLTQMGFEGLLVGRIDYRDKNKRIDEKNLDFIWKANDNFDANLFTTTYPNSYIYESGFCFDVYCDDELNDDNLQDKVQAFTNLLNWYKEFYKTNNILIPMGGDFTYQKAEKNFDNLDRLIAAFQDNPDFNLIYSTPSCYIQAVKDYFVENKISYIEKTDDFFPYASDPHAFWTGYYSSRPTSKRFERLGNNILQSAKQLTTFARINGNHQDNSLLHLRSAMGVMQHHDAITGTEKQKVADDYSTLIYDGIINAEEAANEVINDLLRKPEVTVNLNFTTCLLANVSVCDNSRKNQFVVAIQNPLSKTVSHYVRLPVDNTNFRIRGPGNEKVQYDVFDQLSSFSFLEGEEQGKYELVFFARDLPPLGVTLYYVETINNERNSYRSFQNVTATDSDYGTQTNGFTIDPSTGKLQTVRINGVSKDIQQEYLYYHGFTGDNSDDKHRSSGAYVFRPEENEAVLVSSDLTEKKFAKGNLVDQLLQVVNDEISQIVRVYKGDSSTDAYIEFDWLIGNLQTLENKSREVITRFTVDDFNNNNIFYTDSNGRQQLQRQLNYRPDYTYDATEEPVSSNYYPVTAKIVIKDTEQDLEVAVLNDRAQGGSSLENGEIELLVHRRDLRDDSFGVEEALNEVQWGVGLFARGQHFLTFGTANSTSANGRSTAAFERDLAQRKLLAPWVLVADATGDDVNTLQKAQNLFNFKFEALLKVLPENVHILTLEPWKNSYILRLEHILEQGEDDDLSKEATVDLTNLFSFFHITNFTETTLGANIEKGEVDKKNVNLKPMEIRTFVFTTDQANEGGLYNGIVVSELKSAAHHFLSSSVLIAIILCVCAAM